MTCPSCVGSGEELVWLAYEERSFTKVALTTESPIVVAHPALRHDRILAPNDIAAFDQHVAVDARGAIDAADLSADDQATYKNLSPSVDRRLERIAEQQFLKFGVPRRDVSYEMCGSVGTVVLSGRELIGASTPAATRPIRIRLACWSALSLTIAFFGVFYFGLWAGPTQYFAASNLLMLLVVLAAIVSGALAVGGVLRASRPRFRWWPVGAMVKAPAAVFAAAMVAAPIIHLAARPTLAEARTAMTRGDLARARLVIDALEATRPFAGVTAARDDMEMTEASRLAGNPRIERLDAIARRNGPRATEARSRARTERLASIRTAVEQRHSADAIALLDQWNAALPNDPEAADLRARAFEIQGADCSEDLCRLSSARLARDAHPSPERETALVRARTPILAALGSRDIAEDVSARVAAFRRITTLANQVTTRFASDADLATAAHSAADWATAQRRQIPLVGAPIAVVGDILERPANSGAATGWNDLQGVDVHAVATEGRCAGLYVIGATAGNRSIAGREPGLERLLAQAAGSATATLQPRSGDVPVHAVTHWTSGSLPVTARWNGNTLMELRIGAATP